MKLLYKINDGEWQEYNMSIPVVNSITINVATATTQTGDVVTHDYDGVYELDYSDYGDIVYVKNGTSISFRDDNYYYPSIGSLVHYGYYDGETGDYVGWYTHYADSDGKLLRNAWLRTDNDNPLIYFGDNAAAYQDGIYNIEGEDYY